jgi:hypothetical protein
MGSSASLPIVLLVVVVLVVGWGSKWLRKDGRMDEGRSKRRNQREGCMRREFRVYHQERPRTKDGETIGATSYYLGDGDPAESRY